MRIDLKTRIVRSGKTQRAVGVEAEINEFRMSDIVRGYVDPTPEERQRIKTVLGCGDRVFRRDRDVA